MTRLALILSILLLLTVACDESDNPTGQETCIDTENGAQMTIEEALQIAEDSECGQEGSIKELTSGYRHLVDRS